MKKSLIILLTISPLLVFAEGQDALGVFLDTIDFIKIFSIWAVVIFAFIKIFNYIKPNKLDKRKKKIVWFATGLIALFIWSMIKHDPYHDGPIDSIFKKKLTFDPNETKPDSTIEYVWSVNKNEEGVYIWIDNKKIFVRKFTEKEIAHEGLNDSLTMFTVRGWEKEK